MGTPEVYRKKSKPIDLKTGITRQELREKLISLRYERNDTTFERGKFRIKGDIFDIYPVYMVTGYRIEFFGNEVESISEINPLTGQKIRKNIERISIMPATHYIAEEEEMERIIEDIREELRWALNNFESKNMFLEAQRIKQRTEYDIEMIKEA